MSNDGSLNNSMSASAKRLWALGGTRAYYRGLTVRREGELGLEHRDLPAFCSR